ncbi:uncharacterized protein LOC135084742 [Ostrinia nubilalis]|uniref:uncharacterized protein LOC135084742 n=1 Tax=Ostrinia nubilalis TaxID=29057 RepID=UPI0030825D20
MEGKGNSAILKAFICAKEAGLSSSVFKMNWNFTSLFIFFSVSVCAASYHEQYRVPKTCTDKWESYVFNDMEYVVQNLPVNWENAKILCRGHHNGSLAVLDTKEKAEFLAEALSESQLSIESVWVGARRGSADDPAGYRWGQGLELRRTAADVYSEAGLDDHYPAWLNRTRVPVPEGGADCVARLRGLALPDTEASHSLCASHWFTFWLNRTRVPVPEGGADCVALERARHDRPVFVDLPCQILRPFACERGWLNRTRVPVPEGGADCVALERARHDRPVFVDLPCQILRPFACERGPALLMCPSH